MEAPRQLRSIANEQENVAITRREYEEENVIAVDFGPGTDATIDTIGDTAIVVAGDRQFEFEVPSEASEITTNDGILLIKEEQ